tara:strand:- start:37064 stop:37462 length:399 start_codon:yes stop_codon:yes gene_type:complete
LKLKGKHISKFLILIAGLIIFAHAVIPHHHHFDSIDAHSENSECKTSNSDMHSENPETHCHAFNITVSEKQSDIVVNSATVSHLHFDLFSIEIKPDIALNINDITNNIHLGFSLLKQKFLTNHSLRAPPATA